MSEHGTSFTLEEIRVQLSDAIRDLRAGSSSPQNANAISNVAGSILRSVKLEMEYAKAIGRRPNISIVTGVLPAPADERTSDAAHSNASEVATETS